MTVGTARGLRADAVMAASILLLGFFLCAAGWSMVERWQLSAARRQGPDVDDLLGAVAVTAGVAIVAWWILSMILASTAAVLGKCGRRRAADRAGKCCPAFMRRLAVAALSVQLLTAPLAHADVPPDGPAWVPTQAVAVEDVAGQEMPVHEPPVQDTDLQVQWSPTVSHVPAAAVRPDWRPGPPVADPGLMAAQPVRAAQSPPPGEVTVLAGDTLWDIASRHLGPAASDVDVALHWPRWYEANKARIGENPDVLLPGQVLKAPSTA
ncbi:MAG TPA: LysM peptidoglycan-binding domain-containing protein [Arthrobacter sp.]|nr:LysM peptidoglycan-binding domain-containing protein [Arthrobacter sp.]